MVKLFGAKRTAVSTDFHVFGWDFSIPRAGVVSIDQLAPAGSSGRYVSPSRFSTFDGEKFPGGYGDTQIYDLDYWTLRQRSSQLFTDNIYARGLIRRLVTNEINTGLTPECCPEAGILGVTEESLLPWTDDVENRFGIWSRTPELCDYHGMHTFGALQRAARAEALISGDVLVINRYSVIKDTIQVQLVRGDAVQDPLLATERQNIPSSHTVRHGVERDAQKKIVAYWVRDNEGVMSRVAAYGEQSGRRVAWLVFGTDRRLDDERGVPLLGIMLQSLREIDRYRDSVQRKAVVNSILAMFVTKAKAAPSRLPISGGAVRNSTGTVTDNDATTRQFRISDMIPGLVIEELEEGEEPKGFGSQGTDLDFGKFEEVIIQAIAWANEIPPEILRLAFSNNYSASQAAINEFKIYLNRVWSEFGEMFCAPIYVDWLLTEVLSRRIVARGMLDAWRNPKKWVVFGAWIATDWYGSIKPSTDVLKQAKGSQILVQEGWSTNAREARMNTGSKFDKNIRRLARENQQKADAMRPVLELQRDFGKPAVQAVEDRLTRADIEDIMEEYLGGS